MSTIDTATLRARLAAGERLWLVHAAETVAFRSAHLPGAVAFADAGRATTVLRKTDSIVVYGLDRTCRTSRALAAGLSRCGYPNVAWYADGLRGWMAADGDVEGTVSAGPRPTREPRR